MNGWIVRYIQKPLPNQPYRFFFILFFDHFLLKNELFNLRTIQNNRVSVYASLQQLRSVLFCFKHYCHL